MLLTGKYSNIQIGGIAATTGTMVSTGARWAVNVMAQPPQARASNTRGWPVSFEGAKNIQGMFDAYSEIPVAMPGSVGKFFGTVGDDWSSQTNGLTYSCGMTITSVSTQFVFGNRAPTRWSYSFSQYIRPEHIADDEWQVATGTYQPDTTAKTFVIPHDIQFAPAAASPGAFTPYCVTGAQLSFSAAPIQTVNSCTGPNVTTIDSGSYDMQFSAGIDDSNTFLGPLLGQDYVVRIYSDLCNQNRYWEINAINMNSVSGLNADIESGAIVNYQVSGGFTAYPRTAGSDACTRYNGYIKQPDGTYILNFQSNP